MLTYSEKIIFIVVSILALFLTIRSFGNMIRVINRGEDKFYFNNIFSRLKEALSVLVLQKSVLKSRPVISLIHSVIAWSFIIYLLVNLGDIIFGFTGHNIFTGYGIISNLYQLFVDIFSVAAIVATAYFLVRRFLLKSDKLEYNENVLIHNSTKRGIKRDSLIVGLFIILHIGFRFIGESIFIKLHGNNIWQPFASVTSELWGIFGQNQQIVFQHFSWWVAIGLILAFVPYFPNSKHAHLFMGPINFLTKPNRTGYSLLRPIEFEDETSEQFGTARIEHLDKTQILDAYACIMCNRCQDVCPAYVTGKSLSPSALEINKRYYINENKKQLAKGVDTEESFTEFALSSSALWACTSCGACSEICPVGNEPVMDILNVRRDKIMMESDFPKELQGAFNGMERNQNPWNMNEDRLKWIKETNEELKAPTVDENPGFDILYWVGCAGAFDQRGQKIARAFTRILNASNINFAILGNRESCTGDSARRAGNEYLFAMMAEANVDVLNSANVKKIVTTCPHCLHTLKNEYSQFGGNFDVIHHSQFIEEIIETGKLKLKSQPPEGNFAFHDPCYLGRHNRIFDAPRQSLRLTGLALREMERNRENSFCCGAGGAQMWKEEEKGNIPVRQNRLKEAESIETDTLCTGCPFCMTMLSDAANETQSSIEVKDIAQIIAEIIA
jgi:Fe-S oxidoreductase